MDTVSASKSEKNMQTRLVFRLKKEETMKKIQIAAIACILCAALLGGCRDRADNETRPSATHAPTTPTQTVPTTYPSTVPMPSIPMPEGTNANPGSQPSEGVLDPDSRMPRHGGPRR